MILDFPTLIKKYNIKPKGVIQLGAHYFQEKETFVSLGINDFVLVEPQEHAFNIMFNKTNDINALCFRCAVSDFEGKVEMYCDVANEGQSSSLLKPKEHIKKYPQISFNKREKVDVERIENLEFDRNKYNILAMDLQGGELKALLGSGYLLDYVDCIYTEVNFIELYKDCVLVDELDKFLYDWGFRRVETGKPIDGWSDAFYIK